MEWDELRGTRDELLTLMDRYQLTIVWNTLTTTQQNELIQYRTDLLTLPQDYDTPQLAWDNLPTRPSWMTT